MKLYLFSAIEKKYDVNFYRQMRQQNVRIVHMLSLFVLFITIALFLSSIFIDYPAIIKNYYRHLHLTNYFLISSLCMALLLSWFRMRAKNRSLERYHPVALPYALMFMGGCLWLSFLAQENPSNTLTMLLLGQLMIAALVVLSLTETFMLMIANIVTFTIGLGHFQTDYGLWLNNYIGFCFIMIAFFIVSRLVYSYHANYYIKVKIIEDKNVEIEQANHAKDDILSMVAHDLRSPVANIQSLVELMLSYPQTEDEKAVYFSHIKDCCIKADTIIRDIVIAAEEEYDGTIERSPVLINSFLTSIYKEWDKIINGKRNLTLKLPERETTVMLNRGKIQRVMDNLINNAIKFTPEGNGTINIRLQPIAGYMRISVKDNGIGIPEEHLPYLFNKFTPAGRQGLNNEPSIGLGLNISKQIIEQHSGALWVETEENKGSCFYIDLPLEHITLN